MSRNNHRHNRDMQPITTKDEITEAFLYVIQCKDENEFVKIGITNENPSNRVAQLQTGNPYELLLIAAFPISGKNRFFIESTIHKQLEMFSLRGEWFRLTAKQAVTFLVGSLNLFEDEKPRTRRESHGQPYVDEQAHPRLTANKTDAMIRNQTGLSQAEFAAKAGISLLDTCLKICDHNRKTLAARSGVSISLIKEIQAGRRRVTGDARQKLERVLTTQES